MSKTERVSQHERYWTQRLSALSAMRHPYMAEHVATDCQRFELTRLSQALATSAASTSALDVVVTYLARLSGEARFDIGLYCEAHAGEDRLASFVPLRLVREEGASVADFVSGAHNAIARAQESGEDALQLAAHNESLRERLASTAWPIALSFGAEPDLTLQASWTFWLAPSAAPQLVAPEDQSHWQLEAVDAQLASIARALMSSTASTVSTLPLLSEAEQQRIVIDWNRTDAPIPELCAHTLIERQAAATPEGLAVRFGETTLTYAQLDAQANQLAHALVARGIGKGDLVALCLPRSVEVVVGMLGILKAGAAYVPIDPSYPRDRVESMLQQSAARVVVTRSNLRASLVASVAEAVCFDLDQAELGSKPTTPPESTVTPDDLIYVIFTSGSTGAPKGVEIPHRSLVNHSLAIARNYELTERDRVLCSASVSFDVAAEQIYPALFSGAQVVVRPDDLLESFQRFDRYLRDTQVTTVILPTAYWHEWVRELSGRNLTVSPSLRVCSVGTEKALGEHLSAWLKLSEGRVRFCQGYGPTETTVTCTMYLHEGEGVDLKRPLPIGRPLPNTQIYVLDANLTPVPVGMEGEVYVAGAGVARGYLGRPDLTAERFIANPFHPHGGPMYRTGDVARYEPDGQLVYVGRSDFQVKIRGHRIELGEIEAAIRAHPQVDECVVLLREDVPGQRRLVAYVVPAKTEVDKTALTTHVAERLPDYMAPSAYVMLSAFPMTPNLKVDRKALPPPALERARSTSTPSDDEELLVAQIWSDVLGVQGFGMDESFFDLGGDSLLAVRVFERLQAACAAPLSLADLFAAPTVAQLAARIRSGGGIDAPTLICLKPGDDKLPVFLVCGIGLYLPLARTLRTSSAVHAMYLPIEAEIVQRGTRLPPVEELAARYIALLRSHAPHGPYALGGVSFGGILAYEMARQLRAAGESVPVLALLDPVLPRARLRGALPWLSAQVRSVRRHGPAVVVRRSRRRLAKLIDRVNPTLASYIYPPESKELDPVRAQAYGAAIAQYDQQAQPCEGPAILFRASDSEEGAIEDSLGFRSLVRGELSVHDLPGDHLGILAQPQVRVLAEHFDRHLAHHTA